MENIGSSMLIWSIQSLSLLALGIIAYFLKDMKKTYEDRLEKSEQRVDEVEEKLDNLKSDLPFVYATREDFIRAMNNVDMNVKDINSKLDKLIDHMIKGGGAQ